MSRKQLNLRIQSLQRDHVSGTFELSMKACKIFKYLLQGQLNRDRKLFIEKLRRVGRAVIRAHPEAASIYNCVNRFVYYIERGCGKYPYPDRVREYGLTFLSEEMEHMERSRVRIGELGSSLLQRRKRILTLSLSETVKEIFLKASSKGFDFEVVIMESRPLYEGRLMAASLCRKGIRVRLIADASFYRMAPEVDMVLVGTDRIGEDTLTNKIGTGGVAVVSKHLSIPLYAACETIKILPEGISIDSDKRQPARELWDRRMKNLRISNYHFDLIPLDFFTGFITERGVLRAAGIRKIQGEASRMKVITLKQ